MKQSNFTWYHFQLVLRQIEHCNACLGECCGRPCDKLVVAEIQRANGGQLAKCMWKRTQEVVT